MTWTQHFLNWNEYRHLPPVGGLSICLTRISPGLWIMPSFRNTLMTATTGVFSISHFGHIGIIEVSICGVWNFLPYWVVVMMIVMAMMVLEYRVSGWRRNIFLSSLTHILNWRPLDMQRTVSGIDLRKWISCITANMVDMVSKQGTISLKYMS